MMLGIVTLPEVCLIALIAADDAHDAGGWLHVMLAVFTWWKEGC